jgi:hypothetical protein
MNRVYLATIAAIVGSMLIILVLTSVAIDPYIKATNWGVNLFDFYENNNESNKIFIIGDSLPQWGIDSMIIDDYLQNKIILDARNFYNTEVSCTSSSWMSDDAALEAYSPENCIATLSLRATSFYRNRTLEIYAGDDLLGCFSVSPSRFAEVVAPVYLSKGANTVRLHVPEGSERPSDINGLNNSDNRRLSVMVGNVTLNKKKSLDHNQNSQSFKYNVYNLAHSGDSPRTRIVELSDMVKSKPKIVVFCLQYRLFTPNYSPDNHSMNYPALEDRFALLSNKIMLDPYTRSIFDKKELDLIQMDFMHLIAYKRRLLIPCLQLTLSKVPQFSKVPYIKPSFGPENGKKPNFKADYIPPKTSGKDGSHNLTINEKSNIQKEAILHMIDVLKSQGINVIIITMPYRHEYFRSISNESRINYLNFINKTHSHHYDLISYCSDAEFYNNVHVNFYGRQNVTIKVAEILKSEAMNATK